ncbi:hypothetical protein ACQUK4_10895, partial [Ralstonia pseudosolanacearum]
SAPGTTRKRRKTCSIGTSFPRCGNLEQDGSRFHSRTPLISVSLEGDICVCKCNPPPRLIASQNTASMSFDEEELRRMGLTADGKPLVAASPASVFDDRFQILDASTGEPIANAEYAIERANGEVEHGITDQHGRTHLLTATEQAEVVRIYV